jgi:hypothetical protein
MENKFLIPEDKSLIPQWMKKHGYRSEDMKRPDGWVGTTQVRQWSQ